MTPISIETEAKFRVTSHEAVRERLRAAGAQCLGMVLETNRILDRPGGMLRRQGCGLRLRTAVSLDGTTVDSTLTFKGQRAPGAMKKREELEVEVKDAQVLDCILDRIGLVEVLWYQKHRESWGLDGCRVELDEPPHLGFFVEIEGPDESAIRRVQGKVGLRDEEIVSDSYVHMLLAYCNEHGITDHRLALP